jgi:hypothetical protein
MSALSQKRTSVSLILLPSAASGSHSKSDVVSMIRDNAYIACPIHKDRDHFVKSAILV